MNTSEKTCFKCLCVRPLNDFYKHKMMADGHLNKCKPCTKSDVKNHRAANIDRIREYDKSRAIAPHRVEAREKYRKTEEGKAAFKKAREKYLLSNQEKRLQTSKRYYERNKSKCQESSRRYIKENFDKVRAVKTAAQKKRHSGKILRTPHWLAPEHIEAMKLRYKEARWMTNRTGVKHHVDHIVPLNGSNVSGLHVPWNLRVIPARENMRRGNK